MTDRSGQLTLQPSMIGAQFNINGVGMILFLIDRHRLFREGLRALLERDGTHVVVGEARSIESALTTISEHSCEVIVAEVSSKSSKCRSELRALKSKCPGTPVLVVSSHSDNSIVREVLEAGADGFLLKSAGVNDLLNALESVGRGGCYLHNEVASTVVGHLRNVKQKPMENPSQLSPREKELLVLLAKGLKNNEIADELYVSVSTIKNHLRLLFKRFKVSDRTRLVVEAINLGLISQDKTNS